LGISGYWGWIVPALKTIKSRLAEMPTETATIGERAGPGFDASTIVSAIERVVFTYLDLRLSNLETFLETFRRVGAPPFKAALYPDASEGKNAA
jgi:sulfite reductase (NADPH) hemoprotein beta-component